jgi:hypothetical protein
VVGAAAGGNLFSRYSSSVMSALQESRESRLNVFKFSEYNRARFTQ